MSKLSILGVKRHCTPIVLTVSVDGTDTIYSLGYQAFQIIRTRNPNAITRCMLRRSSVILALLYYKKYIVELELKMTSNLDRHGRICPSTISCTLLLIRTKTSQKSQENAGCSSPSLWTLLMKLWVDLEHMPAISRNNINFLKSQEPIGWTRTDFIKCLVFSS